MVKHASCHVIPTDGDLSLWYHNQYGVGIISIICRSIYMYLFAHLGHLSRLIIEFSCTTPKMFKSKSRWRMFYWLLPRQCGKHSWISIFDVWTNWFGVDSRISNIMYFNTIFSCKHVANLGRITYSLSTSSKKKEIILTKMLVSLQKR